MVWGVLAISTKRTGGARVKLKGKRYNYPNHEAMMVDVKKFMEAGDTIHTSANPITGEYWIEVILKGEQVKNEVHRSRQKAYHEYLEDNPQWEG